MISTQPLVVIKELNESYGWTQVRYPEVPDMPVFPSSSIASCAIHWMLTAAAAAGLELGAAGALAGAPVYRERAAAYADLLLE